MKVKGEREVAQLCPALSDPMDCSLPGSSVHGLFQARVLEWGAIAFSNRGAWQATINGVTRVGHNLVTKPPPTHLKVLSLITPGESLLLCQVT